jgi:hypothetical protein
MIHNRLLVSAIFLHVLKKDKKYGRINIERYYDLAIFELGYSRRFQYHHAHHLQDTHLYRDLRKKPWHFVHHLQLLCVLVTSKPCLRSYELYLKLRISDWNSATSPIVLIVEAILLFWLCWSINWVIKLTHKVSLSLLNLFGFIINEAIVNSRRIFQSQ